MRLIVQQTQCESKMFWIVRDTSHPWFYHGPFADETEAHSFAKPKNSADWKELLRKKKKEDATMRAYHTVLAA